MLHYRSYIKNHRTDRLGLSKTPQIHSPTSFNFFWSTPVLNPVFSNTYTTFYVHTLPTGFIEYGHPPRPPIDESTVRQPYPIDVRMFYMALSNVSWKWTAIFYIGYFLRWENNADTFYGLPFPIVSPRET